MIIEQKTIPKGWQIKQIKDLLDFERPDNYIVKNESYSPKNKIPVLTANKSFILGYTDEDFGVYKNIPAIIFDDFTADSKFVDFPFKVKSSAIKILKSKENVDLRFVFELMKFINFSAANHKRHYISQYQNLEVAVPPINEQKKIAEILSSVDDEIEKTDEIILQAEKLRKGLMQDLFLKGIGHKKFKKTSLGDVPEEWDILKLKNVIKLTSGKFLPKKDFISGKFFVYGGNGISGRHSEYFLENPCIVIGRVGEYCGAVHLTQPKSWVTDNALYIEELKREVAQKFLYYFFIWLNFNQYAKVGGQPSISQNTVGSIETGFPLLKEQQKIAEVLSSVDDKIIINKELKNKLIQLKKGLMQDLLSGKIRIKI